MSGGPSFKCKLWCNTHDGTHVELLDLDLVRDDGRSLALVEGLQMQHTYLVISTQQAHVVDHHALLCDNAR